MFNAARGQDANVLENKTRHFAAAQAKLARLTAGQSSELGDSPNVALGFGRVEGGSFWFDGSQRSL